MKFQIYRARICVEFERPVVLQDARGFDLVGIGGRAWVTIDGDPRDILLERGATLHVEPNDNVVVSGMPSAEVAFLAAASPPATRREFAAIGRRLGAAWRSLGVAQRLQRA
jgi:hypothetical protein